MIKTQDFINICHEKNLDRKKNPNNFVEWKCFPRTNSKWLSVLRYCHKHLNVPMKFCVGLNVIYAKLFSKFSPSYEKKTSVGVHIVCVLLTTNPSHTTRHTARWNKYGPMRATICHILHSLRQRKKTTHKQYAQTQYYRRAIKQSTFEMWWCI